MADTVTSQVLFNSRNRRAIKLTNIGDSTGEADVIKFDISTFTGPNGAVPTSLTVEEIWYNIQGYTSVRLEWDATTDDPIAVLSGSGYLNFKGVGGARDPKSSGTTGDILLTTAGNASGNTYTIIIVVRLED